MSYAAHFSRLLKQDPPSLNFAAHHLHPLPDACFEAQQQAWCDSLSDDTMARLAEALAYLSRHLKLADGSTLHWSVSADTLLMPLFDAHQTMPMRMLCIEPLPSALASTLLRLERLGRAQITRVDAEPFRSFEARWSVALRKGGFDWICLSQCCAETGFVPTGLTALSHGAADSGAQVLIDGSHAFMALDTDLSGVADVVHYLAAAPAYAMSGAGYAFLHVAGDFTAAPTMDCPRTFDPAPLYRFITAMQWADDRSLTPAAIHAHAGSLQARFLSRLDALRLPLSSHCLLPPLSSARGNFLCFNLDDATAVQQTLANHDVIVDADSQHLRIGFGIHHDHADVDALLARLHAALA